jgi:uncharacterized protein YidB (DUF937 family)
MSLLNTLTSAALNAATGSSPTGGALDASTMIKLANDLLSQVGGVSGLIGQLKAGGLADVVASWVGGANPLPVTGEQLQMALGGETLTQLAGRFGGDTQAVSNGLADLLPSIVAQLSSSGQAPQQLGDVANLLGGLFKG